MTSEKTLQIMQEAFDSLKASDIIKVEVKVTPDTVILGKGSPLDSLGFVTLMTEMEDRMSRDTGQDIFFAINEITDFNMDNPFLSAIVFANYMATLG
jgi:acyl carrier protein